MIFRWPLPIALLACVAVVAADPPPKAVPAKFDPAKLVRAQYQVVGLFDPERAADLKDAFQDETLSEIKLIDVDYANAEMTVEFTPKRAFPGASKPEQFLESLNNKVRQATHHTIGVKPLRTIPLDQLQRIEIEVASIHCRACSLGLYNHVMSLDGVEQATASAKEGRVTVLIHPNKVDRAQVETRLRQRGVVLKNPPKPQKK